AGAGAWSVGNAKEAPAAVFVEGSSKLMCEPAAAGERAYNSTQFLALARPAEKATLVIGYLTGVTARLDISANFKPVDSGTALRAQLRFLGRQLAPGATLELDPVYLSADADAFEALEKYGDA